MVKRHFKSYGIIAIDKEGRILMVCRRNTIGFMEFLKGDYKLDKSDTSNRLHINDLIHMMTADELNLLINESYERIFYLTRGKRAAKKQLKEKEIFEKNRPIWIETCKKLLSNGKGWKEPEWGFPKGNRNQDESEIECALRELKEETGVSNITLTNHKFVEIRYECDKQFLCEYYVAYLPDDFTIDSVRKQAHEISDIGLFTIDECLKKVRHYLKNRIRIIESLKDILLLSEND